MKKQPQTRHPRAQSLDRRDFLRWGSSALLAPAALSMLGSLGCREAGSDSGSTPVDGASGAASFDRKLQIGYIPITDATPLLIGHAKGFFQGEGLEVDRPTLIRGWSQLAEAFLARSFNLVHLLMPIPIYMRFAQQHPVKVVAWNHINGSALTVGLASNISSIASLGGKQIAVPYWYSIHNILLQQLMRTHGLKPVIQDRSAPLAADQTNLFVMAPPEMPPAMSTGAIDGYIVAEPFNSVGETLTNGKIIRFTGDAFKNHPCCVATMHQDDLESDPAWSQAVLNGLVKAQRWVVAHREETAAILSKDGEGYLPFSKEVIYRAMSKYDLETYGDHGEESAIRNPDWGLKRIGFNPYPYESTTTEVLRMMKETVVEGDSGFLANLSDEQVRRELFDYELVRNAIVATGGMTGFDGVDPATPFLRQERIDF